MSNIVSDVFVRKGQRVPMNHKVTKTYAVNSSNTKSYTSVYASNDENPGVTTNSIRIHKSSMTLPPNFDYKMIELEQHLLLETP